MKKLLFILALLTTTVSAYSQLLNWNATQNKANSISPKGDANGDGEVDISDVVFVVNEILSGDSYQESCDVNGDGYVDISDVVELVNIILNGNQTNLCPDSNHPHMIDLGLPSGTKWACCNVGASSPMGYGGYYSWGETEEKGVYNDVTYKYSTGIDETGNGWYFPDTDYTNIGSSICGTQYDVAHVIWGGSWQMPSYEQFQELLDNTYCGWTEVNGIMGEKLTSRTNDCSLFLPAAGRFIDSEILERGEYGYYRTGTLDSTFDGNAFYWYFFDNLSYWGWGNREPGFSVRPVVSK